MAGGCWALGVALVGCVWYGVRGGAPRVCWGRAGYPGRVMVEGVVGGVSSCMRVCAGVAVLFSSLLPCARPWVSAPLWCVLLAVLLLSSWFFSSLVFAFLSSRIVVLSSSGRSMLRRALRCCGVAWSDGRGTEISGGVLGVRLVL